ncbi:Fanconi anemia group C protein [Aplochiton taeniatus]
MGKAAKRREREDRRRRFRLKDGSWRGGGRTALMESPMAEKRGGGRTALMESPMAEKRGRGRTALMESPMAENRGGGRTALMESPMAEKRGGGRTALMESPMAEKRGPTGRRRRQPNTQHPFRAPASLSTANDVTFYCSAGSLCVSWFPRLTTTMTASLIVSVGFPGPGPSTTIMSQLQLQPEVDALVEPHEGPFWLGKAVAWGQADDQDTQRDTCLHLGRLQAFLQRLLTHMHTISSTTEAMKRLPFLGQFLGRLCWNRYVTAHEQCRGLLLQSLWSLHTEEPANGVERKANQWVRNVLCQLATEDEDEGSARRATVKHLGLSPTQYHRKVLRKMVSMLVAEAGQTCTRLDNQKHGCSCDSVRAASVACVPLVTCPEAAPLIGALLQRPATCNRAALSQDFLDAVNSAYSRKELCLEEQAVVSLWCHSLPCLEGAALSLLESVLTTSGPIPADLEDQISRSLLPKACAQHCAVFLLVTDIFRSMVTQAEGHQAVLALLQAFTCCFLRELEALPPQKSLALKVFFPHTPQSLLAPLLTQPSEMPQEAWADHLHWLSGSLKRLMEEEEGGHHAVFEVWFLLVRCGHWVDVAGQLLASARPDNCGALLWLITFYHHPTNRGHHRALQLVAAQGLWDSLRPRFLESAPPPPVDGLEWLVGLLTARPQQPPLAQRLVLGLLVNFAVFSLNPLGEARETVHMVVEPSDACCILAGLSYAKIPHLFTPCKRRSHYQSLLHVKEPRMAQQEQCWTGLACGYGWVAGEWAGLLFLLN